MSEDERTIADESWGSKERELKKLKLSFLIHSVGCKIYLDCEEIRKAELIFTKIFSQLSKTFIDLASSLHSVRTPWPRANYLFPVQPFHSI